jgi:hypothetical protein
VPTNIPPMRALMDDPIFRAYMKRVPTTHAANQHGEPWQLWVRTHDGRWLTKTYEKYQDVWPVFVGRFKRGQDPTIVSRRIFYAPPGQWYKAKVRLPRPTPSGTTHRIENRWKQTFFWDGSDLHWCGRCRRPSYWMPLFSSHHALRKLPAVSEENNFRCILCGIRWIATPSIDQMVKMERP